MYKVIKSKLFAIILCVAMITTTTTSIVFAAYSNAEFGSSEGRAYAELKCYDRIAEARTSPLIDGLSVTTKVTCLSINGNHQSAYVIGPHWAPASVSDCCGAESRHTAGTSTYYLSCNNTL